MLSEEWKNWEENITGTVQKPKNFWNAVKLHITNPHLINRNLAGSIQLYRFKFFSDDILLNSKNIIDYMLVNNYQDKFEVDDFKNKFDVDVFIQEESEFERNFNDRLETDINQNFNLLLINKLIPKNVKNKLSYFEFIIINIIEKLLIVHSFEATNYCQSYSIKLADNNLSIFSPKEQIVKNNSWLTFVLYPKLIKWMENNLNDHNANNNNNNNNSIITKSLTFVNLEKYNDLYNVLKDKYGIAMVKLWPEKTDATKYVYEDIAIATYLILLWTKERIDKKLNKLQTFVDLGCGNGLLVYILSSEGYNGYGIDLRKRFIWDLYPKTTILKVEAITPSNQYLYPDIDWIIGNHSDELSPWIPIIAARSSYYTRYFLLPCCAYEFNGSKYQRRNCKISQYMDFLKYTEEISTICGFNTIVDRLKIPSTKRVCFIGMQRTYPPEEYNKYSHKIQNFINSRSNSFIVNSKNITDLWNNDFKPRDSIERVQNCTQINKQIEKDIIKLVFEQLICKKRFSLDETFDNRNWNIGGSVTLSQIVEKIPKDKLQNLKSECGGLQTLLKNNHQIFQVDKGAVQLRIPQKYCDKLRKSILNMKSSNREIIFKEKPCWFLQNHPDGCPYIDINCSFKHI